MKIITTVGTSLVEKLEVSLKDMDKEYFKYKERKKREINKNIKNLEKRLSEFNSAEIDTVKKIIEKYDNKTFEVVLIATDTLKGYIVAELLKRYFEENSFDGKIVKVDFSEKNVIEGLNVKVNDRDLIKKGSKNLIKRLIDLTSGYEEIYNISGGYKIIIPIITHVASYKKINLAYIHEDSDYLIEVPPFPFEINREFIKYLAVIFEKIDEEIYISKNEFERLLKDIPFEIQEELEYLFEEKEEGITTSIIGDILLEDYINTKEIEIIECEEKNLNIDGGKHHDKEKVEVFGKKLIQSPYVCKILGSAEYETRKKDFILEVEPQGQTGVIKIKIPNEEKATILVKTSGRNFKETQKIAQILEQEFSK
ncbi:MAG: putative CRISPR-associated protein [Nautiliaceae bacterium]